MSALWCEDQHWPTCPFCDGPATYDDGDGDYGCPDCGGFVDVDGYWSPSTTMADWLGVHWSALARGIRDRAFDAPADAYTSLSWGQ